MRCSIAECAALLAADELVAYPTETFWALGCNPCSEVAVRKLFSFKDRADGKGIPLIISSSSWLDRFQVVETVAARGARQALQERFWPGSLTLVLNPGEMTSSCLGNLAPGVVSPDGSIAVRVSPNSDASRIAEAAGGAITSTSLNISGRPPVVTFEDAESQFPKLFLLDTLPQLSPKWFQVTARDILPSTIVDVRSLPFQVLRQGAVASSLLVDAVSQVET